MAGIGLALSAASCGSALDGESAVYADGVGKTDSVEQPLTEACAGTDPDASCDAVTGRCAKASGTADYDHATCSHAWVVRGAFAGKRGGTVRVQYDTDPADGLSYPCEGMWVRAYVWQLKDGVTTLVDEQVAYGASSRGKCGRPSVSAAVPAGDYTVTGQAGYIFGYLPVVTTFASR
jgi:hypothetical protein